MAFPDANEPVPPGLQSLLDQCKTATAMSAVIAEYRGPKGAPMTLKEALANALDTKQMADHLAGGVTEADLKRLARSGRYEVQKLHGRYLWDRTDDTAVMAALEGRCPKCGWKEGEPLATAEKKNPVPPAE